MLTILLALALFISYEVYFKFVINDFQIKQIEKELQLNFQKNQEQFHEFVNYSKGIGRIENLEFFGKKGVRFQISDSLLLSKKETWAESNFIQVGNDIEIVTKDILFSDTNSITITTAYGVLSLGNWVIDFDGKITDSIVVKILSYNNIRLEELKGIQQKMEKVNCIAFDKNENLLTLRYKGHWGESFNYQIPLKDSVYLENWNKLSDNFYWEHYHEELFCGWTDW